MCKHVMSTVVLYVSSIPNQFILEHYTLAHLWETNSLIYITRRLLNFHMDLLRANMFCIKIWWNIYIYMCVFVSIYVRWDVYDINATKFCRRLIENRIYNKKLWKMKKIIYCCNNMFFEELLNRNLKLEL